MPDQSPPIDGRAARSQRTRHAIVDACVALVEEGDLRPKAPRIAARADVSVRSIFQHFADLPSLHIAVTERVVERLSVLRPQIDIAAPLDERIANLVWHRSALLEAMTPFRRAAQVHGPSSPEIQQAIGAAALRLHDQVDHAFAPELVLLAEDERTEVADALAGALSWGTWDTMRSEWGRSPEQAVAAVVRIVNGVLANHQ